MKSSEEKVAYPVTPGSWWTCGRHLFICGDVFTLAHDPPPHDLLYSDPPWNNGILGTFYKMAGQEKPAFDWSLLYRQVIGCAALGAPVWIEGSRAYEAQIAGVISALRPGLIVAWYEIRYSGNGRALLFYSGDAAPPVNPTGQLDAETPFTVLSAYPPGTVLDPCAGRGATALCAERAGWSSVNNELNPQRVSAALARIRKLTGQVPERVR